MVGTGRIAIAIGEALILLCVVFWVISGFLYVFFIRPLRRKLFIKLGPVYGEELIVDLYPQYRKTAEDLAPSSERTASDGGDEGPKTYREERHILQAKRLDHLLAQDELEDIRPDLFPLSGEMADRYQVKEKISEGPNGAVYRCIQLESGRIVAVKVSRDYADRWEDVGEEMRALRELEGPCFPTLYEYVIDQKYGRAYTVMEFIEGENLYENLYKELTKRSDCPYTTQSGCLDLMVILLKALSQLHGKGFFHGDIKPSNVLLSTDGRVVLTDFDIHKDRRGEDAYVPWQEIHDRNDTAYDAMSATGTGPQAVTERTPVDKRSSGEGGSSEDLVLLDARLDIYQLSRMSYLLLTGHPPMEGETLQDRRGALLEKGVTREVADVLLKGMAREPKERYESAEAMLDAFRRILSRESRIDADKALVQRIGLVTAAAAATGLILVVSGHRAWDDAQYRTRRAQEMDIAASRASEELSAGAYSTALATIQDALPSEGEDDLPCTADIQRALAKALGVYDLTSVYRPFRSIGPEEGLLGRSLKAVLSPDGSRIAALTELEDGDEGVRRYIQVFDTMSGRQMIRPLPAHPSALASCIFRSEDTILYAGPDGLEARRIPDTIPDEPEDAPMLWQGALATSVVLSSDGRTAATVYRDDDFAMIYDLDTGTSARLPFHGKRPWVMDYDTFIDPGHDLFVMDGGGDWLAVSFDDGSLDLFDIRDPERYEGADIVHPVSIPASCTHVEGGFCGGCFAFAASTPPLEDESTAVYAVCQVIRTGTWEPVTGLLESAFPLHMLADEAGIWIAEGDQIRHADLDRGTWRFVRSSGTKIRSLRGRDGQILAVTKDSGALVLDREGSQSAVRIDGSIDIGDLGGEALLLASRDRPCLSLLLRRDGAEERMEYPADFHHIRARVRADRKSALLYSASAFSVYDPDGVRQGGRAFPDGGQIVKIEYERTDDGTGDRLRVCYPEREDLYAASDGAFIGTEAAEHDPDGADLYETDRWLVVYRQNQATEIFDRTVPDRPIRILEDGHCTGAAQIGEDLLVTMLWSDSTRVGLLLDRQGETIAEMPDLTDVLPDGTLVFDDGQGHLSLDSVRSMDVMRELAADRGTYRA